MAHNKWYLMFYLLNNNERAFKLAQHICFINLAKLYALLSIQDFLFVINLYSHSYTRYKK